MHNPTTPYHYPQDPFSSSSAAAVASGKEAKPEAVNTTVLDDQEAVQLRIYGPQLAALYGGSDALL